MTTLPIISQAGIDALNARFEAAEPAEIVSWAVAEFGDGLSVGASFGGASGMAILHMVASLKPDVHVFVLDTDYLFEETHETMRRAVPALGLGNVQVYRSRLSHEQQAAEYGSALWMRDPDLCCELRKVEPNRRALEGKTAWISGLRRDQSEGRSDTPIVSSAPKFGVVKINPLAAWNDDHVQSYQARHNLPAHPLADRGYPSIGCWPCTAPVADGADDRSGRWAGQGKTECGLHLEVPGTQPALTSGGRT